MSSSLRCFVAAVAVLCWTASCDSAESAPGTGVGTFTDLGQPETTSDGQEQRTIRFRLVSQVIGSGGTVTRTSSGSSQVAPVSATGQSAASANDGEAAAGRVVGNIQLVPVVVNPDGSTTPLLDIAKSFPLVSGAAVPVSSSSGGPRDCFDFAAGTRKHGEEFNRGDSFRYKYNNGTLEIVACIGPERTKNAIIPLGETLTHEGFWHKCDYIESNKTVRYSQEPSCCGSDGKEYHVSETFRAGNFENEMQLEWVRNCRLLFHGCQWRVEETGHWSIGRRWKHATQVREGRRHQSQVLYSFGQLRQKRSDLQGRGRIYRQPSAIPMQRQWAVRNSRLHNGG